MAKNTPKGFDPSMIDTVIDDFKALNPIGQKTAADLIALLLGKPRMGAVKPKACPDDPGEDCDCAECLQCAYTCGLHSLVAICKAADAWEAESGEPSA